MINDQTPEALSMAAFGDLRQYVAKPHLFMQQSACEFAESLWWVYVCRCGLWKDFDAFLAECVRRVSLANMRAATSGKTRT